MAQAFFCVKLFGLRQPAAAFRAGSLLPNYESEARTNRAVHETLIHSRLWIGKLRRAAAVQTGIGRVAGEFDVANRLDASDYCIFASDESRGCSGRIVRLRESVAGAEDCYVSTYGRFRGSAAK